VNFYEVNMPLNTRSIAASIAILSFFCLSALCGFSGLSADICCKRAIAGAALVYIGCRIIVKVINIILIDAMITDRLNRENSSASGNKNNNRKGQQQR
jgi:hypothetical protein